MQVKRNRAPILGLLWLVVMLFGSYFVINLFVAAVSSVVQVHSKSLPQH